MNTASKHWNVGSLDEVRTLFERERIEIVHIGLFDTEGVFREKRIPAQLALHYLEHGWSFIDALPYWGPNDAVRKDLPYGSEDCTLDATSLRPYPFEPNAALLVADYTGANATLSPRTLLAQQIARATEMGFAACGSAEFEFIILAETPDSLTRKAYEGIETHAQENRCWSGLYPATGAPFMRAYDECLKGADIPLHHMCAELGPGCLEAALPIRDLATAADDTALFKLFTKAFCIQQGLTASFMAQLSDAHPGLGGHPIISLHSLASGLPVFHDAKHPSGLSVTGRQFVAGVLQLLPELMPMFAGTVNSYRRYVPGNWAPRTATWGLRNYTCGLRVVAGAPEDTRLEFRLPGADTNPHLAFAMMLGAGLYGIANKLKPPPMTTDIGREFVHPSIGPLPRTLLEAAERMRASKLARELFGDRFVDHYTESCIQEDHLMRRHISAFERRRYLHHV